MNSYACPHCGSAKPPVLKAVWSTKDKIIAVVLFFAFFPLGIVYVLIKNGSNKQQICPDCNVPYANVPETSASEDFAKMKNVVKTVVKDPNVRQF